MDPVWGFGCISQRWRVVGESRYIVAGNNELVKELLLKALRWEGVAEDGLMVSVEITSTSILVPALVIACFLAPTSSTPPSITTKLSSHLHQTPSHLKAYKVSFIDQLMPPVNYVPIFTYYTPPMKEATESPNSIKILKDSLSETLTRFYPLAGRVQNKDEYVINCNDKGIVFSTARVNNCAMTDFLSSTQPKVELLYQLLPTLPFSWMGQRKVMSRLG
ncbi:hypothetical protein RJ640_007667 [Escallonia rubra]|uniref:Uncharacterized protein n=1 Tax=Escallonia rubra TaxID=112253 RepID=A0AA88QJ65_9ASTE|nr:hypothetical protein RJ640_007667 [Escallonia rubra]